jgi:putrescine aminotransferase
VACAVAAENIRLLRDEGIVDRVGEETAPYLQQRWRELADHPLVGEVRGVGMLGGLELVRDKETGARWGEPGKTGLLCRDIAIDSGLVMRSVGDAMVIAPPLVITREQIDELVERARGVLDETMGRLDWKGLTD